MNRGLYFSFQGFIAVILVLMAFAVISFYEASHQAAYSPPFYESQDTALVSFYQSDASAAVNDPITLARIKDQQFCAPFLVWVGSDLRVSTTQAVCVS